MSFSRTDTSLVDVAMPQMGVSVSEGTIVEWSKRVGDWVAYEETICLISTDKIDTDCPSPAAGRVAEILVEPGTTVEVGTVLARIETDARPGEPHSTEGSVPTVLGSTVGTDPGVLPPVAKGSNGSGSTGGTDPGVPGSTGGTDPGVLTEPGARRRYSPVVARIASEHGIDLAQVDGTGLGGRVTKKDVLAFLEHGDGAAAPEPPMHIESPYRPDLDAPASAPAAAATGGLSRMRRTIGEHMKRSLEVAATCTTWIEVDFARVEAVRTELGTTALPLVARATIDALREFPALNATLEDGDRYEQHTGVHLGIAVSLGEDGLIVPIIRDAQDLSAEGLGKRIKDLARRARTQELVPDEVHGGTFTITNPGQFGSIMATPVINQPQVAILDVEAVVKRPVVVTDAAGDDSIAIRPMCILGLSWDHRALDGALAAQFLAAVRRRLETL